MGQTGDFFHQLDHATHDSFFLPCFLGPGVLGRIVFHTQPAVLFRAGTATEANQTEAHRIIPYLYRSFIDGTVEESVANGRFPGYVRNRYLRAVVGYALWTGNFDWIHSLAFAMHAREQRHDALFFLATVLARREHRPVLAEFYGSRLTLLPFMEYVLAGIDQEFDAKQASVLEPFPFFVPGAKRSVNAAISLFRFPDAAEAALSWFALAGRSLAHSKLRGRYKKSSGRLAYQASRAQLRGELDEGFDFTPAPLSAHARMHMEGQAGSSYLARLKLASDACFYGEYEKAELYLRPVLHWHPGVLHMRAIAHAGLGEYGLAAAYYRRVVKRHPREAIFCENYGRLLKLMGEDSEAERALNRARELAESAKMVYA
ncbi:MAG: hypothetical protein K8S54_05125 [Spirochaetia bacterium]|nr:hypothetical protein [Spirochaetia bacterium]